jgi:hypothetical protein
MAEDHRGCSDADQGAKDISGVDLDACQGSARAAFVEEDPVADIEGDGPELLDGLTAETSLEVLPDIGGRAETFPDLRRIAHRATSELDRRPNESGPVRSDPDGAQICLARVGQSPQPSGGCQYSVRPSGPATENDCQKLDLS